MIRKLVISIIVSLLSHGLTGYSKNCPEICGDVDEPDPDEFDEIINGLTKCEEKKPRKLTNTRIVNGREAGERGWMVLIRRINIDELGPTNDYGICGGSLLNKRYVLTAAHCICTALHEDDVQKMDDAHYCVDDKPHPEVEKHLLVYVGLNSKIVEEGYKEDTKKFRNKYEFEVEKAYTPSKWNGKYPDAKTNSESSDIGLLKLKNSVSFDGYMLLVQPLCLPDQTDQSETESEIETNPAYVAGWGQKANLGKCFTNDFGPERHVKCSSHWEFNGTKSVENKFNKGCKTIESPSIMNKRCRQFREAHPDKYPKCPREAIRIRYNKNKDSITCYAVYDFDYGWCGTCDPNAQPNENGYCCDPEAIEGEYGYCESDVYVKVHTAKHWGFCSESCISSYEVYPTTLQETKLSIINEEDCKILWGDRDWGRPVPGKELCGGIKIPYPETKEYRRYLNDTNSGLNETKYIYKYTGTVPNKLSAKGLQAEMNYYLGHSDSCTGDSGGPLWQFIDGRATVIGVVSRGDDCASFNSPGIYTKIHPHLDWINDHISEYNC